MSRRGRRPQLNDRVHSVKLEGKLGRIIGWQAATNTQPERWQIKPEKPGALSCWLELSEFVFAPEDSRRRWM